MIKNRGIVGFLKIIVIRKIPFSVQVGAERQFLDSVQNAAAHYLEFLLSWYSWFGRKVGWRHFFIL